MRRLTISIEDELADTFDRLCDSRGYSNRSEAFRDLLRGELSKTTIEEGSSQDCAATLSYVFNHHERQLANRLATLQHAHHEVIVSSMRVHLDRDDSIESLILRGRTKRVVQVAQSIIAETGVRHGKLDMVPVTAEPVSKMHLVRGRRQLR